MNIFSMGSKKYSESKFFDVLIEKQTYRNFIYSIISLPIGILYFTILLSGILISTLFIFVWIGLPFLIFILDIVWFLASIERKLLIRFFDVKIPKISKNIRYESNQMKSFLLYLKNSRTWKLLGYMLLKFPLGVFVAIIPILFLVLSFLMVYFPITSVFGEINIFNYFTTVSFIEAIFAFFISTIIWFLLLNIINWYSGFIKCFSIKMLS